MFTQLDPMSVNPRAYWFTGIWGGPAMQISGQESPDTTDPVLSAEKWVYASTELRHAERVKQAIAARGLTEVVDVLFILSVIDGHGLFHQPIPAPKQRSKEIRRAARAAANRL